ncbi:hypothetical protein TREMEDRAFT_24631 [Tremella mesenterica DSM 1558]|uniref:uncharacterized protein n=1 Tax=Tremella mesenterica (strain ATCC 24925 / CBS 8224 / DSM 1558 / NBRC 9311 / NRRL Y-6157 / RJB 2259-6 / UBC 559-6) TaxID=578456 RepID=UPI0003F49ABF|nr:uncharacterized protein TREMEDRAFT_24631 [Tremella mesenterica DSM 1558]EIW72717.1 hypothetical protein TREMEDRAFT_24631 [Tremella mesenterica DSM 1558]
MFSSLGLFNNVPCPDSSCHRPNCVFSHQSQAGPSRSSPSKRPVATPAETNEVGRATKRKSDSTLIPSEIKKAKQVFSAIHSPQTVVATPHKPISPIKSSTSTSTQNSKLSGGVPILPTDTGQAPKLPLFRRTPQPYADRQKGLQTLFAQFNKLYVQILRQSPKLAQESALAQEEEVSSTSTNLAAYKRSIHHAAVSISRRPIPTTIPHPSIGTIKVSREAYEQAEKASTSRLTRERIIKYCLSHEEMIKWNYPNSTDMSLTSDENLEPSAEGTEKICDRCKMSFVVDGKNLKERFGECKYHHGRTAPQRVEGRRKWIYSCCGRERGEAGCEEGLHVFSEKEDDGKLAKRVPFKTVKQVLESMPRKGEVETQGWVDVVGMDCEMISTTAGISLARVTIIDENGLTLLDELVRQTVTVLDLNSRFSGIKPGELDEAVMDLPAVRSACCAFIGPETIIVGHGLENDLRALRLLHDKIIDTAIVFPHDKGHPFRRALRDIVKEKLGVFIQDRTADLGHSSAVDAKATLDLLKWQVRDDHSS